MSQSDPITNKDIQDMAKPVEPSKTAGTPLPFAESSVKKEEPLPFAHGQLLEALYWMHDVFEASSMNMLLIHHTAEQVLARKPLDGDSIHIGVRQLEWESGSRSTINSAAQYETDEGKIVRYRANNGVPVIVHVLKDDPCISSPNIVLYQHEAFKLPNPYERFKEVYGSS